MELEFERTDEDIIAFNLHHMEHSAVSRRDMLTGRIVATVLAMAFSGGLYLTTPRYFSWVVLGAVMVAGGVVFLLYPILLRRATVRTLRRMLKEGNNEAILGHQRMRLASEGIHTINQSGESTINWPAVQNVSEGPKHFFLFISALSAVVIPKSCFRSGEDEKRFVELVKSFRSVKG